MRTRTRLGIAASLIALLLALSSMAASANRLSISSVRDRATWASFELTTSGFGTFKCEVIPMITFHRGTFTKTAGALVGTVLEVMIRNCTTAQIVAIGESLPWHVVFVNFTGTLPNITSVKFEIVGMGLEFESSGTRCRLRTTTERPANVIFNVETGGRLSGIRLDETAAIPLEGGFLCTLAGEARLSGTSGPVTVAGSTTNVNIRLI